MICSSYPYSDEDKWNNKGKLRITLIHQKEYWDEPQKLGSNGCCQIAELSKASHFTFVDFVSSSTKWKVELNDLWCPFCPLNSENSEIPETTEKL